MIYTQKPFTLLLFSLTSYAAVNSVNVGEVTRQQSIVTFRVNNPAQCTATVYRDSALTDKVDDTNEAIFPGSESCARRFNIIRSQHVTAVLGRRTSEVASDGKLHSRSLEVSSTYYLAVVDLTDKDTTTVSFTTNNIPWGDTHIEEVPFNPAGFNKWAYPDLDWSNSGQNGSYIDPISGVRISRVARSMYGEGGQGDNPTYEFPFTSILDLNSAWTNVKNANNTSAAGPFAAYAGVKQDPLWIPLPPGTYLNPWAVAFATPEDVQLNIYGSAADTGTLDDRKVLVCLGVNFNPSSGKCSTELEVTLSKVPGEVKVSPSYPSFQLDGWKVGRYLTAEEFSVPNGTAAVANSAVTLTSGYLPATAAVGMKVNINGAWYTIGALKTATTFTLAEEGINTSGAWCMGSLGFRVRKKTTAINQINIAATYSLVYGYHANQPAGAVKLCSDLTFPVGYAADGTTVLDPPKTGRLCMSSTGVPFNSLILVTDDGETRYLSDLNHQVAGSAPQIPFGAFHSTDPYSIWAVNKDDSVPNDNLVFYKVTYDYANSACRFRQWNGNGYLRRRDGDPCMIWTNRNPTSSGNTITQQIAATVASNPIWDTAQMKAPKFVLGGAGISGNYAMFYQNSQGQNSPTFYAVFDLLSSKLVKLFDSFSGSLNGYRWAGSHSNGMEISTGTKYATISMSLLPRDLKGWLAGPFFLPPVVAKSLDGVNWNTNTELTNGCLVTKPSPMCGSSPVNIPAGVMNFGGGMTVNNDGTKCVGLTWVNGSISPTNCAQTISAKNPNSVAGVCGPNPYGVTGPKCVWLKLTTDRPCNATASAIDAAKWPCPWTSGPMGGSTWSSPQSFQVGDMFAADPNDGTGLPTKPEGMRVLTKNFDGTNWVLMVERWAYNDNLTSDPNGDPPAQAYYDHLFTGILGSIHPNGWRPWMLPSGGGGSIWLDLSLPAASTPWKADSIAPHYALGQGPNDPTTVTQVGSLGSRTGTLPDIAATPLQHFLNISNSVFAGVSRPDGSDVVEQYPNIANWASPTVAKRSLYWDWRHINPSYGTSPEVPQKIWSHNYTLVDGQTSTYKMDIHDDIKNQKERRPNVFSARSAFYDISSAATGNVIDDSKPFAYCYVYKADECRTGSAVGDLYVVAPNANIGFGGCATNTQLFYTPCATPLWHFAGWMVEGSTQEDDPTGSHIRRITMGLSGPAAQYEYTSPQMLPDGSYALVRPNYPGGVRPDMLLVKLPPPAPVDSLDRSGYIPAPVSLPAGSAYARVRFGYIESGAPADLYCTSRQESCVTDANLSPFAFASSDSLTPTECASGCTINVPALSGRILYYRVERSQDGSTGWIKGPMQVRAIQ